MGELSETLAAFEGTDGLLANAEAQTAFNVVADITIQDNAIENKRLVAEQEEKRRAEDALAGKTAEFEYAKAQAELAEAVAQLRAIEKLRKMKVSRV